MHFLLRLFIIVSVVTYVSCCGKKKKLGRPGLNQKGPMGCQGTAVQCLVGNDVHTDPYSPSGDEAVSSCDKLNCQFDSSCCWTNNKPPADLINWVKASGSGESAKMQRTFGTTTMPSGGYLLTASDVAGTSEQTAQMYSCPITCANGDITVKLKHWQSAGTKIEVCHLDSPSDATANCKTLSSSSGHEDTVTVPGGQNSRIAIVARGFTEKAGSVAIIDDVMVECQICPDTTTPTAATPGPTEPTKAAMNPPCKEINCNFEQGNPCSYSQSSSGGNANKNWGAESAPYQNPLTGVKKASNEGGSKFGASYLKKKGEQTVLTTNANFDKDYVVRFLYYKATEGVNLKACCDDTSKCPFDTTPDVQVSHYKNWRTASIMCPAGTKQVHFVADNQKGTSEGAVGIDNIQLLQSAGSPDSASTPACTGSR